jgi:hypothetical protein
VKTPQRPPHYLLPSPRLTPSPARWSAGDVVCHVFTRQEREYYDLESFYAEAPVVRPP